MHKKSEGESELVRGLAEDLAATPPEHLTYEALEAQVDGTAGDIEDEIARMHLADCGSCRRELRDLEHFRDSLAPGRRHAWIYAAAAAIAAFVVLILLRGRTETAATPFSITSTAIVDSGRAALPEAERMQLDRTVATGKLAIPASADQLRQSTESLRGITVRPGSLEPLAPFGCIVVSDRPTFEWTPVAGARYKVEVFGEHFRPVIASGLLETTRWTPATPLPRGERYVWQVTAYSPSNELTAPAPPQPEARFEVLDLAKQQRIATLAAREPQSHLALGVAYAEVGAIAEAQRELAIVVAENHGAAPAQRLLHEVQQHVR